MTSFKKRTLAVAVAMAAAPAVFAGTAPYFIPLTQDAHTVQPMAAPEVNSPWFVPAGITQVNATSMKKIEADAAQSVQRVPAGQNSSMWDMSAFDSSGNYLFIPHETPIGAGVTRYDIVNDKATLIFAGDQMGPGPDNIRGTKDDLWENDFGAFDPARYTPNGTVIAGEEWSGLGRIVEIMDPWASPADPVAGSASMVEGVDWRVLPIANVSHEGINFSLKSPDQVIYFIDEDRSGSIYKMVLKTPGDYTAGQTFVLKAQNYLGDVTANWNSGANGTPAVLASRFGLGAWEALTDVDGVPLPGINPITGATVLNCAAGDAGDQCRDGDIRPGRVAADDVGGTPFGRPEDMGVQILPNGNEILYITTTSESSVISIEETGAGPMVRLFASENGTPDGSGVGTPKNEGFQPTSARLNSPDNIAIDSLGNVYIIEDGPNNGNSQTGIGSNGDIWFARDMDNDGVAESIDHFMSLQASGAEATGMIFSPNNPTEFYVSVQHPRSVDLSNFPDGLGDALWKFDVADVAPPACEGPRSNWMTFDKGSRRWVRACSNTRDFNLPERMDANAGPNEFPVQ